MPSGTYTVLFTQIAGWIEPPPVSLTVTENETAVAQGDYLLQDHLDPILHLRLDEISGGVAVDSSGHGRHGLLGEQTLLDRPGINAGAVATAGPGGSSGSASLGILVPDFGDDTYTAATVSLWYRLGGSTGDSHDGYLFHWGGSYNDPDSMSAYLDVGTGLRVRVHDSGDTASVVAPAPAGFDDDAWHHLVITKSSTGSAVYFDGSLVLQDNMGAGPFSPATGFGLGLNEIGTYGLEADFDDVRLWARALDAAEVADLYSHSAHAELTVDLGPAEARAMGVSWKPVGDHRWYASGETAQVALPRLPGDTDPVPTTITFSPLTTGWIQPEDQHLALNPGDRAHRSAIYQTASSGSLTVFLEPAAALPSDARWRLTSEPGLWHDSGETVPLAPGSYTVTFAPVDDWIAPADLTVTINDSIDESRTAVYSPIVDQDPILHLKLDETSGGIALDATPHGRHGTVGADVLPGIAGIEATAMTTTGPGGPGGDLDDGIQVPDFASDDSYAEATVALWYRLEPGSDGYLFHWGGSYKDRDSISIYVDRGTQLRIRVHDSQDTTSTLTTTPTSAHGSFDDAGWHQLVVVKSPTGTEVFFDGVSVATHPMGDGPFVPGRGLGLGTNERGTYGTSATFDELQIWERALDAEEIASLFQASAIGRLTVLLEPEEVRGHATWRLEAEAEAVQRTHGEQLTLAPGPATVIFTPVSGYSTPDPLTVDVRLGQTVTVTGDYDPGDPSPIVHLPLDDTTGAQAIDISSHGRHGRLGSRLILDLDGVDGRAVQTAGVGGGRGSLDDGLEIPFTLDQPLDELTVAFWYRLPPTVHDGYLFAWGGSYTDDRAISAYVDVGSELRVRVRDAGDHSSEVPVQVAGFDDAGWHHLAIVKDSDGASVYFDGSLAAQASSGAGGILPGDSFYLGSNEIGRYGIEATFDDLRIYPRALEPAEVADLLTGVVVPDGFGGAYRTVDELRQELLQLASEHEQTLEIVDFGDSWAKSVGGLTTEDGDYLPGDDLLAARITRLDTLDPSVPRPVFVLASCLHAREIATPEVAMRLIEHLLDGYDHDADITWLIDHHEVWILPMVNPDGRRMVELGALRSHGSRPWHWRKNVHATGSCAWPPSNAHTFGVDLNRNFPYQWGLLEGVGGAGDACDSHHRGASAGSEPETQALMSLLSSLIPDQRAEPGAAADPDTTGIFIQLHSPFRTVAWPWAVSSSPSPELEGLAAIGHKLADLNGYDAGQAEDVIYPMSGTADDWVHGELGAAAFLLEVGEGLMPAFNRVDNVIWPENRDAFLYAAKIARTPYQTAHGPDVGTITVSTAGVDIVTVSAVADDSTNSGDDIAEVELYVDDPPWAVGALSIPILAADDGSFDSPTENVSGMLHTGNWSSGRHTVYVRARDAAGHWGPVSAAFVWVD